MFGLSAIAIKAIIAAVGISAIVAAGSWFVIHQRNIGRDAAIAQMTKDTAEETERRIGVVVASLKNAEADVAKLKSVEEKNADLLQQIETLSARNDAVGCLDADSVRRLQELDGR